MRIGAASAAFGIWDMPRRDHHRYPEEARGEAMTDPTIVLEPLEHNHPRLDPDPYKPVAGCPLCEAIEEIITRRAFGRTPEPEPWWWKLLRAVAPKWRSR
jgi:hypothetical protein